MLDEWLTEMLGYPVYNSTVPPESNERSLTWVRVPVEQTYVVHGLLDVGFRIVDVNGWFDAAGYASPGPTPHVKLARPEHHEVLLDIAYSSCFSHSRFHRDALTLPHADRIKREWLRNCLEGRRGEEVLVAVGSGGPIGFLAVGHDRGGSRTVDLFGVDPLFRGHGVGRDLLTECRRLGGERSLGAGTSLANTAALRLYETCGFKLCAASYVLHLHRGV